MRNRSNNKLALSKELLNKWKNGEIDWGEYKATFLEEMENPESRPAPKDCRKSRGRKGRQTGLLRRRRQTLPPTHLEVAGGREARNSPITLSGFVFSEEVLHYRECNA